MNYILNVIKGDFDSLVIKAANVILEKEQKPFCCSWLFSFRKFKLRYFDALNSLSNNRLSITNFFENKDKILEYQERLKFKDSVHFFSDRINEYNAIFPGQDISSFSKNILLNKIEEIGRDDDKKLFEALSHVAPIYFFRKMAMPNYKDLINFDIATKNNSGKNLLDYGCGAADVSLYACSQDYNVTICDVAGGNLDAARKRFEYRNLFPKVLEATPDFPIPELGTLQYDIINAVEVIEHIRTPIDLLEKFYNALKEKGILIVGSFPFVNTNTRGDHLPEAINKQQQLLKIFEHNFEQINNTKCFIKKDNEHFISSFD